MSFKKSKRILGKSSTSINESIVQEQQILMNEIDIAKYNEFELIKINDRGIRQSRIFGIDLTRVYNKKVKQNEKGISRFLVNLMGQDTTNPTRFTKDIEDIKIIKGCSF